MDFTLESSYISLRQPHGAPPLKPVAHHNANSLIEEQLDTHLAELEKILEADVMVFHGSLFPPMDSQVRDFIEGRPHRRRALAVLLETNGGFADVVERMARCFRKFYRRVDFIVPNHAMSAGTLLVMSGDRIFMNYFSVLGPIDPQVPSNNGYVPANGYLVQYDRLIEKSKKKTITTAELQFLIANFNPAELYRYEQEMNLSVTLLKEGLVKYKFRNWKKTATRKLKVTAKMRKDRAEEIANKLNDTNKWHVHARGIPMGVLRKDLKLVIEDFDKNQALKNEISCYQKLLYDYLEKNGANAALNIVGKFVPLRME